MKKTQNNTKSKSRRENKITKIIEITKKTKKPQIRALENSTISEQKIEFNINYYFL